MADDEDEAEADKSSLEVHQETQPEVDEFPPRLFHFGAVGGGPVADDYGGVDAVGPVGRRVRNDGWSRQEAHRVTKVAAGRNTVLNEVVYTY